MNKILGIDVSKRTLDVYFLDRDEHCCILNEKKGINELLLGLGGYTIFYEATGVYSTKLVQRCLTKGLKHIPLHPTTLHHLGLGLGDRNKTDKIDARKIAYIGKLMQERGIIHTHQSVADEQIYEIHSLLSAIRTLKKQIILGKQVLDQLACDAFASEDLILFYKNQGEVITEKIETLHEQVVELLEQSGQKHHLRNLCTIPGISDRVATVLLVFFLTAKQKGLEARDVSKLKALVGIDPIERQSGTSMKSSKISKKGVPYIRQILYTSTLCWYKLVSTEKYKQTDIGKFFVRMQAKFGTKKYKNGKSISVAMMKKLLLCAWGIYWNEQSYDWR